MVQRHPNNKRYDTRLPYTTHFRSRAKRILPCLDVDNGRVVKGVKFENIRDAGDPVEIALRYDEQGADEITFLDITASVDGRDTTLHTVERLASQVFQIGRASCRERVGQ